MENISVVIIVVLMYAGACSSTNQDTKCPDKYGYMCMAGNTGKRGTLEASDNMRTRRKSYPGGQLHEVLAFLPYWLKKAALSTHKTRLRQQLSGHASVVDVHPGTSILKRDLWRLIRQTSKPDSSLGIARSDTYQTSHTFPTKRQLFGRRR